VVGLWVRAARRAGAEVITVGAAGSIQAVPGGAADTVRDRLADRIRKAERAILIGSGPGGRGGATVARLAHELGAAAAFSLPATPNGRAVASAWGAAGEGEPVHPDQIGVLLISGEEAVADPSVRELAARAQAVVAITMFADPVRGWVDLVLPGTSYLERDGTMVNLEGRPQRLRRTVIPPTPDEVAWIAKLARRFGVDIDPHARAVTADERAPLPAPVEAGGPPAAEKAPKQPTAKGGPLRLLRYRPLFSGPAVERVEELQFQRPEPAIVLSAHDAEVRHIASGDEVVVRSNGTSVRLRARVDKRLVDGAVRAAEEHVRELDAAVEVSKS
jgi:anaerobic selenocysteine-containing dehydrogenase